MTLHETIKNASVTYEQPTGLYVLIQLHDVYLSVVELSSKQVYQQRVRHRRREENLPHRQSAR